MSSNLIYDPIRPDQRYRLAKLQVLIVDTDQHAARLLKGILISFGLRQIEIMSTVETALESLRTVRTDLIITEGAMDDLDGIALVKAIRAAKNEECLRSDMPILMLTARSSKENVEIARDAGITEFVAKPFSAGSISARLVEIIDRPRVFVEAPTFSGPSRRRRPPPPGIEDRRRSRDADGSGPHMRAENRGDVKVTVSQTHLELHEMVGGIKAGEIITAGVIEEAQQELMKSENEFVTWVKDDIQTLDQAYATLEPTPGNISAKKKLIHAAYTIKAQSGIFGYNLGTSVADLLISYLDRHMEITENNLIVVRKHIDAISVIFNQQVKNADSSEGKELVDSLSKLVAKFG